MSKSWRQRLKPRDLKMCIQTDHRIDLCSLIGFAPCYIYCSSGLTLKAPVTIAADDIHKYFFNVFQRK